MSYRWKITKDHIGTDSKGICGPSDTGNDLAITDNREHFVMKDDDGETYYEGEIYGDFNGFEPLDDYGTPNAGCTSIFYGGEML